MNTTAVSFETVTQERCHCGTVARNDGREYANVCTRWPLCEQHQADPTVRTVCTVRTVRDGEYIYVGTATLIDNDDFPYWAADTEVGTPHRIGDFDTRLLALEAIQDWAGYYLTAPNPMDD